MHFSFIDTTKELIKGEPRIITICIFQIIIKTIRDMDLNKTITYEELFSMWHFIELNSINRTTQEYTNTWATGANIPEGKTWGIEASYGIYIVYPKTSTDLNYASTPIFANGSQSYGEAQIMIYDTVNSKYVTANVVYANHYDTPSFTITSINKADGTGSLNESMYFVHGWIYGKEVIS